MCEYKYEYLYEDVRFVCCVITFRLRHHHSEEPDGSIDVTEPAAVKLEEDGGLGDHSGPVTNPGSEGGHWRTWRNHVRMFIFNGPDWFVQLQMRTDET